MAVNLSARKVAQHVSGAVKPIKTPTFKPRGIKPITPIKTPMVKAPKEIKTPGGHPGYDRHKHFGF